MNYYIDEETKKKLDSYKIQVIVLLFLFFAVFLSLSVTFDLYKKALYNRFDEKINNNIFIKSKISTLIYILTGLYFVYLTYDAYIKKPNKQNLSFLIASLLGLLAALIRYVNITRDDVSSSGDLV